MFMADVLAETLNKIKNCETLGRAECKVASTKLVRSVLLTLKKNGYVTEMEEEQEGKFKRIKVTLSNRINDIGVVRPRYAVSVDDFQKYENRFIPSRDFGLLIVSTPGGIMTNRDAKEKKVGGRLIAYVY
jgi:small subunit ribosomal protein S8